MTLRHLFPGAMGVLLGGLILAGCATAKHTAGDGARISRADRFPDAELEKRVRTVAHYATGLSHELNDQSELALEEMLRAAHTDPTFEPIVLEAARRCIRAQKPEKAIELLTKAASLPGAPGTYHAWLGLAYAQAGKTDLAISANRAAIKKLPQSLVPYQNLAQVYLQTSRTNEALRVLDEAARQTTDDPGFLIELADLYVRFSRAQATEGDPLRARAQRVLDRAADLDPSSPLHLIRLADTYFALGELTKAEPFYRKLLEEQPDLPSVRAKLTDIYLRNGDKEKASQQLAALALSEPTNPQAYLLLGALAVEQKNWAEAAEHLERAIRLDPDLEQVYFDLAGLHLTLEKPEQALAVLDKARSRFKRSFPLEFYTAIAYAAAEKYPDALQYLTSAEAVARAMDPSRLNHVFYFQAGATHERAGNVAEAETYFREALKLAPDDPETLNYLGYMWADRGVNLDEARTLIEKAVQLQPDSAAFLDSLAWVLFKLNKPQEALEPMVKAIEHSKKPDATLYDHLGDIYAALNQLDKAREAWSKALSVKPDEAIEKKLHAPLPVSQSAP